MTDSTLDLSAVRMQLSKMADRILMRLHDRSGFPLNRPVYERGAVKMVSGQQSSFLELGAGGDRGLSRVVGPLPLPGPVPVGELDAAGCGGSARRRCARDPGCDHRASGPALAVYIDVVLPQLCVPGEDAQTYGETVYIDADTLELLNERIQVGRKVAMAKIASDLALWDLIERPEERMERLRDRAREEAVLEDVEQRARRYEIDPALARSVFVWVIEQTIRVEVAFLQGMRGL